MSSVRYRVELHKVQRIKESDTFLSCYGTALLNKAAQSHDTTFTQVESDWLIGSCHRSHGFLANIPVTFLILNVRGFFNYKLMTLYVFNEKAKLRGSHFAESEAADVF
ncbi:hypothetical protein AVEN_56397-1 [Araneus ventricosus]|uniref:Uncharacterized protein n=1 Tax=Araneus ventricosus TaxID=182803 RepID=A0A4Y2LVZ0_ARAVE|nr:hypothetical protein AVEN_56397-1 [Araneus ventricosus]